MDRIEKNLEFLVANMAMKEDIANMATHDDIALIVANMATKEDIEMLHHEIVGKTNSAHTRIDQEVDKHNQLEVRVARLETTAHSH